MCGGARIPFDTRLTPIFMNINDVDDGHTEVLASYIRIAEDKWPFYSPPDMST